MLFLSGPTPQEETEMGSEANNESEEWEPPHEFEEVELLPWPIDAFPELARKYIAELARATETPIELSSMILLSVVATAAQKKYVVEIKEHYRETVNLWTLSNLPPASRKSCVYDEVTEPIRYWENERRKELEPIVLANASKQKTIEQRIKYLRTRAAKEKISDNITVLQSEIEHLEKEVANIVSYPRLWTSDVTPEHLGTLMAMNDEAMALLSDEGGIFDILVGLYSRGTANIDLILQSHSGGSVRVDRGSRPPIDLERALLSMGLTVQPEVVKKACGNRTFRGRGLMARFLFVFPKSNIGYRNLEEPPMDEFLRAQYRSAICHILNHTYDLTSGSQHPHILKLEPEAYSKWLEYSKAIEQMMSPEIDYLTHITDWAGKLSGQIARIAALLHIFRYAFEKPWDKRISLQDMEGAVKIGHALIRHAIKTFGLIDEDEKDAITKEILNWVDKENLQHFSRRECSRKFRKYKKEKLEPGLDDLKKRSYIYECPPTSKIGAPSIVYLVNPKFKRNGQGQ